jgi:ferrochelatase
MDGKLAIVLFNLGGPDSLTAVRPFLFNLFKDPAIISLPFGLRHLVARLIARRRAPIAAEIYRQMGGRSPILPGTEAQAAALRLALADLAGEVRVEIAMRYWHPFSAEAAARLAAWRPDRVVLLPLYPQYSTTTTGSSLADWRRAAAKAGLTAPTLSLCCYPRAGGWVMAQADLIRRELAAIGEGGRIRLLFSAHGLPKKVIDGGDPYQSQVELGAAAIMAALGRDDVEAQVSYQSRVGPLEWIGPSTESEIRRAGAEGVGLLVLPIAFVSEHSETLVELDIEYGHLARDSGVPVYRRVPAVADHPLFIGELAAMVRRCLADGASLQSGEGVRICRSECGACAYGGMK